MKRSSRLAPPSRAAGAFLVPCASSWSGHWSSVTGDHLRSRKRRDPDSHRGLAQVLGVRAPGSYLLFDAADATPQEGDAEMSGIDVEVTDHGPALFEVRVEQSGGQAYRLPRQHPDVLEIEELAYGRLLAGAVRSLPAGAIRVRICEDQQGNRPCACEVADCVARAVASRDGGWRTWA